MDGDPAERAPLSGDAQALRVAGRARARPAPRQGACRPLWPHARPFTPGEYFFQDEGAGSVLGAQAEAEAGFLRLTGFADAPSVSES